jgi:hypothetical protein
LDVPRGSAFLLPAGNGEEISLLGIAFDGGDGILCGEKYMK